MSPVKYGLGFYIPEDDILHSYLSENLKSYKAYIGIPLISCSISGEIEQSVDMLPSSRSRISRARSPRAVNY
jgi:hypothetical protein